MDTYGFVHLRYGDFVDEPLPTPLQPPFKPAKLAAFGIENCLAIGSAFLSDVHAGVSSLIAGGPSTTSTGTGNSGGNGNQAGNVVGNLTQWATDLSGYTEDADSGQTTAEAEGVKKEIRKKIRESKSDSPEAEAGNLAVAVTKGESG